MKSILPDFEHRWCGKCSLGEYSQNDIENAVDLRNESFREGYSYGWMAGILSGMDMKIVPMTDDEIKERMERAKRLRKDVDEN